MYWYINRLTIFFFLCTHEENDIKSMAFNYYIKSLFQPFFANENEQERKPTYTQTNDIFILLCDHVMGPE